LRMRGAHELGEAETEYKCTPRPGLLGLGRAITN
jgi:hypothetical protein